MNRIVIISVRLMMLLLLGGCSQSDFFEGNGTDNAMLSLNNNTGGAFTLSGKTFEEPYTGIIGVEGDAAKTWITTPADYSGVPVTIAADGKITATPFELYVAKGKTVNTYSLATNATNLPVRTGDTYPLAFGAVSAKGDLIYAQNSITPVNASHSVELAYKHIYGKVKFVLKKGVGIEDADINNAEIKISGYYASATFNLKGGVISSQAKANDVVFVNGTEYYAIPQVIDASNTLSIGVSVNGENFTATIKDSNGTIEANKLKTITITVNRPELAVETSVVDWAVENVENVGGFYFSIPDIELDGIAGASVINYNTDYIGEITASVPDGNTWITSARIDKTGKQLSLSYSENSNSGQSRAGEIIINIGTKQITIPVYQEPYAEYIGSFGGELVRTGDVWSFTKSLYVNNVKSYTPMQWAVDEDNYTSLSGCNVVENAEIDGKANTWRLCKYNSATFPIAQSCMQSNRRDGEILSYSSQYSAKADASYKWFLPAQGQLMALWIVNNVLKDKVDRVVRSSTIGTSNNYFVVNVALSTAGNTGSSERNITSNYSGIDACEMPLKDAGVRVIKENGKVIVDCTYGLPDGATTTVTKKHEGIPSNTVFFDGSTTTNPYANNNDYVFKKFEISLTDEPAAMDWATAYSTANSGDWRLPTQKELYLMWIFKKAINEALSEISEAQLLTTRNYWSETEQNANASLCYYMAFSNGVAIYQPKASSLYWVRKIREIIE